MAKIAVSLKIDVSKIEKARLFKGQKGTYLDATAFIDIDEQGPYGDNGMVTQDVTKEEREQGVKGPILGNVKVFWRDDAPAQPAQSQPAANQPTQYQQNNPAPTGGGNLDPDLDIPF